MCVREEERERECVCVCACVQCDDSRDGMGATASNRIVGDGGMKKKKELCAEEIDQHKMMGTLRFGGGAQEDDDAYFIGFGGCGQIADVFSK